MKKKQPMIKGDVTLWQCSGCGEWLLPVLYYKDSRTPNGLKAQCRSCHTESSMRTRDPINARRICRESMRRCVKSDPEKYRIRGKLAARKRNKNTPAVKARTKLNNAVRSGKVVRPNKCEDCGCGHKLTAHHEDYTKPLAVEWLCYECHGKRHWKD